MIITSFAWPLTVGVIFPQFCWLGTSCHPLLELFVGGEGYNVRLWCILGDSFFQHSGLASPFLAYLYLFALLFRRGPCMSNSFPEGRKVYLIRTSKSDKMQLI